ncbi:MAG: hypothetical protein GY856_50870, partial [bacterium]|nr:hypothetical protein [bacterium]
MSTLIIRRLPGPTPEDDRFQLDLDSPVRVPAAGYPVELTVNSEQEFPGGHLSPDILPWVPGASPAADGERLFTTLFAADAFKTAWAQIRGQHPQRRLRLRLDDAAPELHAIPWELLRDPSGEAPQDLA